MIEDIDDVIELRDGIYTNTKTIQNQGKLIYKKSEYIEIAKDYLVKDLNIRDRVVIGLFNHDKYFGYVGLNSYIYIDPCYKLKINIETLCHEIIHFKQMKSGRLSFVYDKQMPKIIWENKEFPYVADAPYDEYINFPWEREANLYETTQKNKVLTYLSHFRKQKGVHYASWNLRKEA